MASWGLEFPLFSPKTHILLPVETCIYNLFFERGFATSFPVSIVCDDVVQVQETVTVSLVNLQYFLNDMYLMTFLFMWEHPWDHHLSQDLRYPNVETSFTLVILCPFTWMSSSERFSFRWLKAVQKGKVYGLSCTSLPHPINALDIHIHRFYLRKPPANID